MYFAVTIHVSEEAADLAQALLHDGGALGLEMRERGLVPAPGTPPPPAGEVVLVAYFEGEHAMKAALHDLAAELPDVELRAEPVKPEDWSHSWKQHVRSVRVGRVWVGPAWLASQAGDAPVAIVIDPGIAFGTGDHPTTAMCLSAVDDHLLRRPGASVLDVGTGTGILGIAAKKLGAGRVVAVDNDPVAVEVAAANARANGADIQVQGGPLEAVRGQFDLVVANILSTALVDLAPALADRLNFDGEMALCGILGEESADVAAAYQRRGLVLRFRQATGVWQLLRLARRT